MAAVAVQPDSRQNAFVNHDSSHHSPAWAEPSPLHPMVEQSSVNRENRFAVKISTCNNLPPPPNTSDQQAAGMA